MTQKRTLSERVIPVAIVFTIVFLFACANVCAWFAFETVHEEERAFDQQWCAEQARKACER